MEQRNRDRRSNIRRKGVNLGGIALAGALVAACGGGGGGGSPDSGGDGNSPPTLTSASSISAPENQAAMGYTAAADDADGDSVSFSLSGGADQGAFTINPSSGTLLFNTAPDFENPADSDGGNDYEVEIQADDGNGGSDTLAVTVNVTNTASVTNAGATAGNAPKELRMEWDAPEPPARYRVEVNADGASGYSAADVNGDGTVDGDDEVDGSATSADIYLPVHRTDFDNARYRIVALDAAGQVLASSSAVGLLGVDTAALIGYFKAFNTDSGDLFGSAAALSADGATLAVGAPREDSGAGGVNADTSDNSATDAGAVYVFIRDGGQWTQQAYIKAPNPDAEDQLGRYNTVSLSADGNTLAVGAPFEDSNATGTDGDQSDNSAEDAGAAYVYTRSGDDWSLDAYIKASNTDAGDRFANTLDLSDDGTRLAIAAPVESSAATGIGGDPTDNSVNQAGAVYVFERSGGGWAETAYIKASNTETDDLFGTSVALSGDGTTLAAGAQGESSAGTGVGADQSDNTAPSSGAVYVFSLGSASWSQQAYIKTSNSEADDLVGSVGLALSANGDTLAMGTSQEEGSTTGVGGNGSDNSASQAGAAYVFVRNDAGNWSEQAYIKASNTDAGDAFGYQVALDPDGDFLVVTALLENSAATGVNGTQTDNSAGNAGAAYTYSRGDNGGWNTGAYLKASNQSGAFGSAMALSADGGTLAIGAIGEAGGTTGIGGDQTDASAADAGAVYLF